MMEEKGGDRVGEQEKLRGREKLTHPVPSLSALGSYGGCTLCTTIGLYHLRMKLPIHNNCVFYSTLLTVIDW